MLTNAIISPHPPILIPSIGQDHLLTLRNTRDSLNNLAKIFAANAPETCLIISPHAPVIFNRMTIFNSPLFTGSFAQFGYPDLSYSFTGDETIAEILATAASTAGIPTQRETSQTTNLDHGCLVPLHYFSPGLPALKLVVCSFSLLPLETHFVFGQAIGKTIIESSKKISVIASGDLSHRLTSDAPAGYNPAGKIFDETVINLLKKNGADSLIKLDTTLIENAGECGLRSIIILLGILSHLPHTTRILSYEGPFGVGYVTVDFNLS